MGDQPAAPSQGMGVVEPQGKTLATGQHGSVGELYATLRCYLFQFVRLWVYAGAFSMLSPIILHGRTFIL